MYQVQELMRERTYEEPLGQPMVLPPIIKTNFLLPKTVWFHYVSRAFLPVLGSAPPT
jgi:hypothetical protein